MNLRTAFIEWKQKNDRRLNHHRKLAPEHKSIVNILYPYFSLLLMKWLTSKEFLLHVGLQSSAEVIVVFRSPRHRAQNEKVPSILKFCSEENKIGKVTNEKDTKWSAWSTFVHVYWLLTHDLNFDHFLFAYIKYQTWVFFSCIRRLFGHLIFPKKQLLLKKKQNYNIIFMWNRFRTKKN